MVVLISHLSHRHFALLPFRASVALLPTEKILIEVTENPLKAPEHPVIPISSNGKKQTLWFHLGRAEVVTAVPLFCSTA